MTEIPIAHDGGSITMPGWSFVGGDTISLKDFASHQERWYRYRRGMLYPAASEFARLYGKQTRRKARRVKERR